MRVAGSLGPVRLARREAASPDMLGTFPKVCALDDRWVCVAPDYLAGFFEPFSVVCEGDQVFVLKEATVRRGVNRM